MLYWDVKTVTSEGDWKKSRQGLLNTMMQVEIAVPGLQIVGSSMNATRKLQVVAPALCLFFANTCRSQDVRQRLPQGTAERHSRSKTITGTQGYLFYSNHS